jgi:hypothetical protein
MVMADLEQLIEAGPPPATPTARVALGLARAKLNRPPRPEPVWKLVGAAGLAAGSALLLAVAIIIGPPTPADRQTDVNPWVR